MVVQPKTAAEQEMQNVFNERRDSLPKGTLVYDAFREGWFSALAEALNHPEMQPHEASPQDMHDWLYVRVNDGL